MYTAIRDCQPSYEEIGGYWWWNTIGPAALQQTRRACGGVPRMGKSEKYRRFAQECVEMARTVESPQTRAVLLQMAQVWFRLAEDPVGHVAED
jgi:hypothetical protein